jgi:hypothetical protein
MGLVAVCSGAGAQAVSTTAPLMHGSYPAWVGELLQAVSGLLALLRVLRWVTCSALGHGGWWAVSCPIS